MDSPALTRDSDSNRSVALPALSSPQFLVLALLFTGSGAAALLSQLCFSKYLSTVLGSTAHAVSTVLAAFMAGLMLGAALAGKLSLRLRRPLLAYAAAELTVAATISVVPAAFHGLTPAYVELARNSHSLLTLTFARWLIAAAVVVIPTVAMGATLPLVAPALGNSRERDSRLTALYAANTLGGACGSLLGAYGIMPWLGLSGTLRFAAALAASAGLIALWLGIRQQIIVAPGNLSAAAEPAESLAATWRLPFAISAGSGLLIFAVEVVATHLLAVIIGNSVYAFGIILATFLICLFFGALLAPRFARRWSQSALELSLMLSALSLLVSLPLWQRLPQIFVAAGPHVTGFGSRELIRAAVAFLVLAAPVSLMGITFPLLLRAAAARPHAGQGVGQLTAINTLGAVVGSLITGYGLLPWLGSQRSLQLIAVGFLALALVARPRAVRWSPLRALGVVVSLTLIALTPPWDLSTLTAGSNVYFDRHPEPQQVVFAREDVHGGITTVAQAQSGTHTLYTNGKFQGNDGWELHAQRFFSHYPSLFVENFDRALVIGLGTGTTLGTYTAYPWGKIDAVEISPSIVEAAHRYFSGPARHALKDPRVKLSIDDGRNFLLLSSESYDLIGMELTSVWFAGAASLYSREYYALTRAHLKPRGIFQQWVQLHHIHTEAFATILNTLRAEFAHVALFYGGGQGILVASEAPLLARLPRLARLNVTLSRQGLLPDGRPLEQLLSDVLLFGNDLDEFLEATARVAGSTRANLISTDDNLYLEYATPLGNVLPWSTREDLVALLRSYARDSSMNGLLAD